MRRVAYRSRDGLELAGDAWGDPTAPPVVSPEGVAEFLDAVPSARFVDVSGAGHMVAGDRNDAFTEAVVDFLNEAFEVSP